MRQNQHLRLSLLILTLLIGTFSCRKDVGGNNQNEIEPEQTKSINALKSIPGLSTDITAGINLNQYNFYSKDSANKLWIFGLKPGTLGFKCAKVAVSLQFSKLSVILLSFDYDRLEYKKGDPSTYSGTTTIYNQNLMKVKELVYRKGKVIEITLPYRVNVLPMPLPDPQHNWCSEFPPLCGSNTGSMGGFTPEESFGLPPEVGGQPVSYDPNYPFADLWNIGDAPDDPVIDNGITITDIDGPLTSSGRIIGHSAPRGNTEDLQHGTNGDPTGISPSVLSETDEALFDHMKRLFDVCTYFDNDLKIVGAVMIQTFKDKVGGQFSHPTLNAKVKESSAFKNYIKSFGVELNNRLQLTNGDINGVVDATLQSRPIFNGFYNKFHGLQILVNDTESTDIQLDNFFNNNGAWSANITVTIHDHFGLDKFDALKYQGYSVGFPSWWVLQHQRDYVPFETIITIKTQISGHL